MWGEWISIFNTMEANKDTGRQQSESQVGKQRHRKTHSQSHRHTTESQVGKQRHRHTTVRVTGR